MASLARREALAGRVQTIYVDPPYGIKFASNFQPEVGQRDVKDKESDLTREPEMVKAYRDTWTLGVHSYLAYLRDRLMVAKELLTDSGSHLRADLGREPAPRADGDGRGVWGGELLSLSIAVKKTGGRAAKLLGRRCRLPALVRASRSNGEVSAALHVAKARRRGTERYKSENRTDW